MIVDCSFNVLLIRRDGDGDQGVLVFVYDINVGYHYFHTSLFSHAHHENATQHISFPCQFLVYCLFSPAVKTRNSIKKTHTTAFSRLPFSFFHPTHSVSARWKIASKKGKNSGSDLAFSMGSVLHLSSHVLEPGPWVGVSNHRPLVMQHANPWHALKPMIRWYNPKKKFPFLRPVGWEEPYYGRC